MSTAVQQVTATADEIRQLYVYGDCGQVECGIVFGVSQQSFGKWLHDLGIRAKGRSTGGIKGHGREVRLTVKRRCSKCGARSRLTWHYVDRDVTNNEIGNLRLMCRRCHGELHRGEVRNE